MTTVTHDAITMMICENAIDKMMPEQFITVAERPVGTSAGLKWTLRVYKMKSCYRMRVCLWISGPSVQASGTVSWGGECEGSNVFKCMNLSPGETTIAEDIGTTSIGSSGFVKCDVEFTSHRSGMILPNPSIDNFFQDAPHYASDAEFVVGNDHLKVHRSFLSIISPVLYGYFEHDTQECRTGIITITDFEFKTVKNVIDYAYGRAIGEKTITDVIDMLRFADKYDIKTISKLENILQIDLNADTFATVVQYAWDFDKKELQTKCARYYRQNFQTLTFSTGFVRLTPEIKNGIICAAAALQPE
uniref:BTB domain-containing protein n=1 Tax=Panagrellus redivivus TaxID=6233 RepID=A0A7E4V664_PANRE